METLAAWLCIKHCALTEILEMKQINDMLSYCDVSWNMNHLDCVCTPPLGLRLLANSQHLFCCLFPCLGVKHTPWGLDFLHGIYMTGWVDSTHIPLTQSRLVKLFFLHYLLPHPRSTCSLFLCLCISCIMCLSFVFLVYCLLYRAFTCSGPPTNPSLPFLSFSFPFCPAPF